MKNFTALLHLMGCVWLVVKRYIGLARVLLTSVSTEYKEEKYSIIVLNGFFRFHFFFYQYKP